MKSEIGNIAKFLLFRVGIVIAIWTSSTRSRMVDCNLSSSSAFSRLGFCKGMSSIVLRHHKMRNKCMIQFFSTRSERINKSHKGRAASSSQFPKLLQHNITTVSRDSFSRFIPLIERELLLPPDYKIWIKPLVNCAQPFLHNLTHSTRSRSEGIRRRIANRRVACRSKRSRAFQGDSSDRIEDKKPSNQLRWRRKRTSRVEHALRRSHPSTSGPLPCLVPRTKTRSLVTYTRTLVRARG